MHPSALGRYRISKVLGHGGMGVVYEGHDPQIDRRVAIKTIAIGALSDEELAHFEGRFLSEMRSAGRLQHHNIVALYDTGRDGGTAFIVMELVIGQDLKRRLAAGQRFGVEQAVDITVQLLTALEFAHRRHVVHRDVKPANVMLQPDGVVKLCDFGVARLTDADATRTQGMVVGSLRYASPEQITGLPIDERTDVFSAGVLLYELLTGELPFKGQSDVEILHRIATAPAPSARAVDSTIPADIDDAVRRALAKDPAERFASAAEFARALGATSSGSVDTQAARAQAGSAATGINAVLSVPANSSRPRPALLIAAGSAVAAMVVAGWWLARPAAVPHPAPARTAFAPASTPAPTPSLTPSMPAHPASAPASSAPAVAVPVVVAATPAGPRAAAAVPTVPVAVRPVEGAWRGQFSCGPSKTPGFVGPGSEAFKEEVAVTVTRTGITWSRSTSTVTETAAGSFDARARFIAEGVGARRDGKADWRVQGKGEYQAKAARIEGQVQLLRKSDGLLTRDCTLVAERATGGTSVAKTPVATAPAPSAKTASAVPQGGWTGELSCGAAQGAPPNSSWIKPFVQGIKIDVVGTRLTYVRESEAAYESAAGSFDDQGRFSAAGNGNLKEDPQRSGWTVLAQGAFNPTDQRLAAKVELKRARDGSALRDCTLTARQR